MEVTGISGCYSASTLQCVNTQLNFGYECYSRSSAPSRSVEKAKEGADGIHRVMLSSEIAYGGGKWR